MSGEKFGLAPQMNKIFFDTRGGINFSRKFVMQLVARSGSRMVMDLPGNWVSAEYRPLQDLEFFNSIAYEAAIKTARKIMLTIPQR
jgi:hypothetical protein